MFSNQTIDALTLLGENKDVKLSDIMFTILPRLETYRPLYEWQPFNMWDVDWITALVRDGYVMLSGSEGTRLTRLTLLGIPEASL